MRRTAGRPLPSWGERDFARKVAPKTAFPIHDTGLSERGYPGSWRNLEQLGRVEQLVRLPADGQLDA